MAKLALILTITCLFVSTLNVYATRQIVGEETNFPDHACLAKGKLMKLHFFVQDLGVNYPNTTTYDVAHASITANSPTDFGKVRVADDLITEEADPNSRPLGRIQGLLTKSDLNTLAVAMNVNIYFTAGQFAGSSLSILGRNEMGLQARELVVAGGTGVFRFSSGIAIQSTASIGTDFVVLEYYVYVYTTTYGTKFIELDDVEVAQM